LQKDLRSEVRQLSVFKTIKKKERAAGLILADRELGVLLDARDAILETVNQKKRTFSTCRDASFTRT